MKKSLNALQKVEDIIMVVTFALMVLASFVQVVNRNITKIPVTGLEEVSKYCMIYMVLLGTEKGLRDGTQISVTALADKIGGKGKLVLQIISKALVTLFAIVMCKESIALFQMQIRSGQRSPGLGLPMTVPYFALVLSFAIISLVQLAMLVNLCKDMKLSSAELIARDKAAEEAEMEAYNKAAEEEKAKVKGDNK